MSSEKFLIDTTVWIKFLRGLDASLKDRLGLLLSEERALSSEIIIMEILRGAKSEKEYNMLYQDFLALPLLVMDHNVWETAWKASYNLRRGGINIPIADTIILATAVHHKCTLLHSDKHFTISAKYTGLKAIEV